MPRDLRTHPLRLFVAVYPGDDAARAMIGALPEWCAAHRVTPVDQVHMTLFFIGDTHPRDVDGVRESVRRSCSGLAAFDLTPARLALLPERDEPRLAAVMTDAPPALMELQRRLVQRLVRRAGTAKDNRFVPHITLCRFRERVPVHPGVLETMSAGWPAAFRVESVSLVQSVLKREGPVHTMIERVALGV